MENILWLDEYRVLIEDARKVLTKFNIEVSITFKYAIVLLISRMTLTMCEIYTLLKNGYPEGALALSRSVIEGAILIEYICQNQSDTDLIERFFDDEEISRIEILEAIRKYAHDKHGETLGNFSYEKEMEPFINKYAGFWNKKKKKFSDYWWVEKDCSFTALAKKTELDKTYPYIIACKALHMSVYNSRNYCMNVGNGILIGDTYDGIEKPAWISMLYYCMALDFLNENVESRFSNLIEKGQKLTLKIYKALKETMNRTIKEN